jgi:ubiquinone biosynthesis protein COQ9
VAVTGEESAASFVSYKQAASTELSHSTKRALAPPTYKGTSLRELRDFLLSYKVYFNVIKEQLTRRQIAVAVLYIYKETLR